MNTRPSSIGGTWPWADRANSLPSAEGLLVERLAYLAGQGRWEEGLLQERHLGCWVNEAVVRLETNPLCISGQLDKKKKYDHPGKDDGAPRGFTAFICWTFQAEHTKLRAPTVGAHEYLRTQALSRIYLDNFPSVQSSWVTQGLEIGQIALKYGANDLGSIMIEENVVSQAGTTFRMGVADMQRLIRDLGYEPHQRDNWYRLLN